MSEDDEANINLVGADYKLIRRLSDIWTKNIEEIFLQKALNKR